jgi:hypothetical protein
VRLSLKNMALLVKEDRIMHVGFIMLQQPSHKNLLQPRSSCFKADREADLIEAGKTLNKVAISMP